MTSRRSDHYRDRVVEVTAEAAAACSSSRRWELLTVAQVYQRVAERLDERAEALEAEALEAGALEAEALQTEERRGPAPRDAAAEATGPAA